MKRRSIYSTLNLIEAFIRAFGDIADKDVRAPTGGNFDNSIC